MDRRSPDARDQETFGRAGGTVRRPSHNTWRPFHNSAEELLATAYSDQELDDLATVLVEDCSREPTDLYDGVATSRCSRSHANAIDVTLSNWLD